MYPGKYLLPDIYLSPKNWFPTGVKLYNGSLFILEEGHLNDDGPTALRIVKIDEDGGVIILVSMGHIGGKSVKLID